MLGNLTGWHLLIILAVVLLIFGAAKLPSLAKAMGQSARILRSEIAAGKEETSAGDPASPSPSPSPSPQPVPAPGPPAPIDAVTKP